MLGKTFKGMTDECWLADRRLSQLEIARDDYTVYVRPELVVEIAFNDVQASPHYPGGLALRFARVKRYRQRQAAPRPTRSRPCATSTGAPLVEKPTRAGWPRLKGGGEGCRSSGTASHSFSNEKGPPSSEGGPRSLRILWIYRLDTGLSILEIELRADLEEPRLQDLGRLQPGDRARRRSRTKLLL